MGSSSRPAPGRSVLALFGPTASGKTALAGILRERLGGEVVSADSAALYAGIPILTAAPDYPAQLVGVVPLDEDVSVGGYQRLAHDAVDDVLSGGGLPIIAGGTGLYFRAALSALELPPPPEPGRRAHWQATYDSLGPEAAHALLAERDAVAAARVHANDRRRVVRALELAEVGLSLAGDNLWAQEPRVPTRVVVLDVPLEELDRRIELRTQAMVNAGVVEEARRAWSQPLSDTARKVLGLEAFATLPLDEAVAAVTSATKRLARYQRKWLRRLSDVDTLDAGRPLEELADVFFALERTGKPLPRQ